VHDVSMQRLSATNVITPKGRIINSCTVDHQTVFMLIMETQVSKLTHDSMCLLHCKRECQSSKGTVFVLYQLLPILLLIQIEYCVFHQIYSTFGK
jgi:hypothetical protein